MPTRATAAIEAAQGATRAVFVKIRLARGGACQRKTDASPRQIETASHECVALHNFGARAQSCVEIGRPVGFGLGAGPPVPDGSRGSVEEDAGRRGS